MSEPRRPGEESPADEPRRPSARYPVFVGIAFVVLIAYATFDTISNDDDGLLGAEDAERGRALAEFAVPDVRGDLVKDANVFQDDCETADNPCPESEQRTPACRISGPEAREALRVCDFFDRPLAISFWFTGGGDCLTEQDAFDAAARRYGDRVNFLSINVRDEIGEVREIVDERGWSVPVGWDRDGAVSNTYRVGLCPTLALAYPGGILQAAQIGTDAFEAAALADSLELLIEESTQRARQVD
jgi:thiol-disulfide isomerase/thioredoxin